ncbi:hypothetical protein PSECIP111951_00011 [Pseudoalteromonas holothuriae]|uniref:ATPase domain-containing protein n=1 Tax=Pseudoalteromonas holothuriae TaxID=2963714 RepID=A0A9W4QU32_9GAMM|nr:MULTISPECIES: hypothetical protein [unclassified Pseudoalteromonas]CAH9049722.1 hypothetical protein PSECIP111951_00011 [Pseudoalteromonas sp. CIP111951]CAH9053131.1 hypothetical protein PSECIP111854_01109 [Pseudoalteromonas sp. CIP111854]
MKKVNWHFQRKDLAESYLQTVYQGAMSRIALLDVRRTGKTTFLLKDLYPIAIENGFIPVYINLWGEPESPTVAITQALNNTLSILDETLKSKLSELANSEVKKLEVGNNVFGKAIIEFSDKHAHKPSESELFKIGQLVEALFNKCGDKAIIIIDEIQHLASSDKFLPVQHALRTALDTYSDICVVFAGSSRSGVNAMFSDKDKPFYDSAFMIDFPRLGEEFVQHCCKTLKVHFNLEYDVLAINDFYEEIDKSPFWMMKLMTYLMAHKASLKEGTEYIKALMVQDGDFEGLKKRLRALDVEVLHLIRQEETALYSASIVDYLSNKVANEVTSSAIQTSVKKLKTMQVISQYGDRYYIESPGFIKYLEATLKV